MAAHSFSKRSAVTVAALMLTAFLVCRAEEKKAAVEADWPQFLGPNRDGVAPGGPKLLDSWPKEGPKLLWKSDPTIPSGWAGGSGSVVVSGGKAFVFVHGSKQKDKILIPTQMLKDLGWAEDVPDDLAKKIEEARVSGKRGALSGAALDVYIKEFMATLDTELARKFGEHIKLRLIQGREALTWSDFTHLSKARDKEFPTFDALTKAVDNVFSSAHGAPGSSYIGIFLKPFSERLTAFTDIVICLDAATGREVWRKDFPGETPTRPANSNPVNWPGTCTPAVSGGKIYAAGSAGIYCLSVKDGAVVWQTKAPFSHTSPQVLNGVAYFCAGELAAFNADTGKELWRQPKVRHCCTSPQVWTSEGKSYVLCSDEGTINCVDAVDGKVLWRVTGAGAVLSMPAISGDTMVVRSSGWTVAYKISPQKAEKIWQSTDSGDRASSPVIQQDCVYVCGQSYNYHLIWILDLKTGAATLRQKGANTTSSTPALADGKVFTLTESGMDKCHPIAFKTTPDKFEVVGEMPQVNVAPFTSPAIAGGRMYLRLVDSVACYDLTGTAR
ncbi:MAG: PQQ-like beta-propeller repeat protein [Planctomycetes bacterium]|nr:PQQ-like beta-propeller repeat protein [Planctomycetota bacterium]